MISFPQIFRSLFFLERGPEPDGSRSAPADPARDAAKSSEEIARRAAAARSDARRRAASSARRPTAVIR